MKALASAGTLGTGAPCKFAAASGGRDRGAAWILDLAIKEKPRPKARGLVISSQVNYSSVRAHLKRQLSSTLFHCFHRSVGVGL